MPFVSRATESEGHFSMVKRHGNLYDKICTWENLQLAFYKAAKHKKSKREVIKYEQNLEANLKELQQELLNCTYHTGKYREKVIYEPKKRIIYILDFKHRVAQWAVLNVIEDIVVNMLIKDTYSCIKKRGMHKASMRTTEFLNQYDYCIKMDIHHFYPSVRQDILYKMIERKFKDKKLLYILKDIIFSFPGIRNIPIGNLSSQFLGNFYLKELDRYILEVLHCKAYIRYCDDFILFGNDKKQLHEWKHKIIKFLKDVLDLELSKCDVFPVKRGIDFMGYRHFKGYNLVRKSTAKRVKRRIPRAVKQLYTGEISPERFRSVIDSTLGWIDWADSYNFIKSTKILEYRREAMAKFSEIASENDKNIRKLEGNSVKIEDWIDRPIKITAYRIEPSKFTDRQGKPKNRIGFEFYAEGTPHVIFTSSGTLIYLIQKYYQKEGLECKIVKKNGQLMLE